MRMSTRARALSLSLGAPLALLALLVVGMAGCAPEAALAQNASTPTFSAKGSVGDYTARPDTVTGGVILTSPVHGIVGLPGNGPGTGGVYVRFANDKWYWDGVRFVPPAGMAGSASTPTSTGAPTSAALVAEYRRGWNEALAAAQALRK